MLIQVIITYTAMTLSPMLFAEVPMYITDMSICILPTATKMPLEYEKCEAARINMSIRALADQLSKDVTKCVESNTKEHLWQIESLLE